MVPPTEDVTARLRGAFDAPSEVEELRANLRILITLRIVVFTTLLGASLATQLRPELDVNAFPFMLIAAVFSATIVYLVLLMRLDKVRHLRLLAYVQILGDLLTEATVVTTTGGIDSPYNFLYTISIITGGTILRRRGAFITAALAGAFHLGQVGLQLLQLFPSSHLFLPPVEGFPVRRLALDTILNLSAFFTVAFLSSHLAEELRRNRQYLARRTDDLLALQSFNRLILENMSSGLLTTDGRGCVTSFNRAAESITGLQRGEVIGRPLADLFPDMAHFLARGASSEERVRREEIDWVHPSGVTRSLGFSISPFRDAHHHSQGYILTFQDLTPFKELAREVRRRDRLAVIGELSASIAHEIRNPLSCMSGSIEILRRELELDPVNAELMDIVVKESDRLNNLVSDFLRFARPRQLKIEETSLADLLEQMTTLLRSGITDVHQVRWVPSPAAAEVPAYVDAEQVQQVFWNIAWNAIDAMPGGGTLTVSLDHVQDGEGDWVVVSFEDEGGGIPPDVLPHIYEPFYSSKSRGSGMGLAIAHAIVTAHGGRIDVHTEPGRGTRFTVRLPARTPAAESPASPVSALTQSTDGPRT